MEVKKTLLLIWFYTGGNILGSNGGKLGGQRLIDRRKPSTGMAQPMTCEGDPASGPRCVHGQCRRHPDSAGPSRCVCDRGWTGPTCDGADTSSPRSAGRPAYNDGAHTNYLKKIVQHVVSEHKKHLHSDSESRDHVLISGQPSSYNDHVAAPTSGEYQATSGRDACSEHYVSHRTELRTCRPGLLCKYGVCSSENKDTYIAYTCTCDKGATGLFCETRCCLDCGTGGQCVLYGNGTRYCECKWGRTGDRCQHTWPHPQVKRHTRDVDPTAAEGASIDRYSWIVWVSCPAALLAVTGLLLVSCILWRTWAARTQKEFNKCRCYEDTRRYDVLVWCQYGDVTEPLAVKEIVPKLERLSLKVCLYVGTPSYRTALEDRLLSLVSSSRCVILLYT